MPWRLAHWPKSPGVATKDPGKTGSLQNEAVGIDFGEVQNVVQELEKVIGGCALIDDSRFNWPGLELERESRWVSPMIAFIGVRQFVAHGGEESALGPIGRLRRILGDGQIGRPFPHQRFQVVAMLRAPHRSACAR